MLSENTGQPTEAHAKGSPFGQLLGFQPLRAEAGHVAVRLPFSQNHLQTHGRIHGGALFALADHASGWAVHTMLGAGEQCATLEMKINYIGALRNEDCVAEAHVLHKGRTSVVVEAEIKTAAGRLVAKTLATFIILGAEKPSQSAA